MLHFNNRSAQNYVDFLREKLDLKGENGILKSAIDLPSPRVYGGREYTKQVRIDFFGIAATTLLHEDNRENNAYRQFRELLQNLEEINENGIRVKIRFLFLYQYSTFARSLIEAEVNEDRSAINQPNYKTDYLKIDSLTKDDFDNSSIIKNQIQSLRTIQILIKRFNNVRKSKDLSLIEPFSENQIIVRFTPISPAFCGLIINDTAFFDTYQYAKIHRDDSKLAYNAPLIALKKLEQGNDERKLFCCVADHFRYLWRHYLTLDCEDVTEYNYKKYSRRNSMGIIKPPMLANYENKSERIKERLIKSLEGDFEDSQVDNQISEYRIYANRMLAKYCDVPTPVSKFETLFITCSWDSRDDRESLPNIDAIMIKQWITIDFTNGSQNELLNVELFMAEIGQKFVDVLYSTMMSSTLSLVILSNNIEDKASGKKYARPNMYHELGFMMRQLPNNRIYIINESDVVIPSNLDGITHGGSYDKGLIALKYIKIVEWLNKTTIIVNDEDESLALLAHRDRLNQLKVDGIINDLIYVEACNKISSRLAVIGFIE